MEFSMSSDTVLTNIRTHPPGQEASLDSTMLLRGFRIPLKNSFQTLFLIYKHTLQYLIPFFHGDVKYSIWIIANNIVMGTRFMGGKISS